MSDAVEDEGFITNDDVLSTQLNQKLMYSFNGECIGKSISKENVNTKCTKCTKCESLECKIQSLMIENAHLKNITKEMIENDQKKQKCDDERNFYIQRLLKTIKKLQLRSSTMVTSDLLDSNRNIQQECKLSMKERYEYVIKENIRLETELEDMKNNFNASVDQIDNIQKENTQMLQFQQNLLREDWEFERKEKEHALLRVKIMKNQIEKLHTKCLKYEMAFKEFPNLLKSSSGDSLNRNDSSENKSNTFAKHIKTHSLPKEYKVKQNIVTLSIAKIPENTEKSDILECPNCKLNFYVQHQLQYLEHFKKCQKTNYNTNEN